MDKKESSLREVFLEAENQVDDLIRLTENPQFKRIYKELLAIRDTCFVPAYEVNKKEVDRIHHIYSTIIQILNCISQPIQYIKNLIADNKGTLFEIDFNNTYDWDAEEGKVMVINFHKNIERMTNEMLTNKGDEHE